MARGATWTRIVFRVSDVDLASRLSFFLWGMPPARDLLAAATSGQLATIAGLAKQTRRMLAEPRADELGNRFAGQRLRRNSFAPNRRVCARENRSHGCSRSTTGTRRGKPETPRGFRMANTVAAAFGVFCM